MGDNSVTSNSDIESSAFPEYHVAPSIRVENEERGTSTERRRPVVKAWLIENLNERSLQNLRKSRIENEEQLKMFHNDVSDTLRLADKIVEDKTAALRATAEKEKSLWEEYLKIKIAHDKCSHA